jgi:hypothetical protein
MTWIGAAHDVTYDPQRSPSGVFYVRCRCTCGLHDSIHSTRVEAGKTGADHLRVVEQLTEQTPIREDPA